MGQAPRKRIRWLPWVLPVILALYLLVQTADLLWYRTHVPVGFQNANWSGRWTTQQYAGLSGHLLVRLPDPLPENQKFKAEALAYYPIFSVWKTGQFVKMDFTGQFSPESPAAAGQSVNRTAAAEPTGGKLKFKAVVGNQVVEYVAVLDETRTRIIGGYTSRSPYDYGYFHIRYY